MQAKYESQIESIRSEHTNEVFNTKQTHSKEIAEKELQAKEELKALKNKF